jgi:hypothetical protein
MRYRRSTSIFFCVVVIIKFQGDVLRLFEYEGTMLKGLANKRNAGFQKPSAFAR